MTAFDDVTNRAHIEYDNLILDKREAEALARVIGNQWINRDDLEAMDVVSKVCEFANPKSTIKPLEKK